MKLEALLQSSDPNRLEAGGRDVGRLLAAKSPAELDEVRRQLAGVYRATSTEDKYRRGFLEALEMVVSGFAREREQRDTFDKDLELVRSRKSWLAILNAIDAGLVNPGALADELHLKPPAMSKILSDLEAAGLLEHLRDAPNVARTKPRRLTPRAHSLLQRLAKMESMAPVEDVVAAVTRCLPTFISHGRESQHALRRQFEDSLAPELASAAFDAFVGSLVSQRVAFVEGDGSIVAHSLELRIDLDQFLLDAIRENRPLPWLAQRSKPLYVRTTNDRWDVLVARANVSTIIKALRDDDLKCGNFFPMADGYEVLYESELLAAMDLQNETYRQIAQGANRRWYLSASEHDPKLDDFIPLGLPSFFEHCS